MSDKMKKLLCLLSLGALLTFCACTDDDNDANTSGNLAQVTFTLETTGGIETRAYSDGLTATYLVYGVYDSETKELVEGLSQTTAVEAFSNKTATVQLYLPKGGSYTIVFWAQAETPPYTVDLKNKTVTLTGDTDDDGALTVAGNDETMDAFYATVETGTVTGNYSESVTLKRPFAQVNIGTSDIEEYRKQYELKYMKVKLSGVANTMNLLDGTVTFGNNTSGGEIIYDWAKILEDDTFPYPQEDDDSDESEDTQTYTYLSMDYVLVGADKSTADVTFYYSASEKEETAHNITVSSVPIQRNYRTNIFGSLLTGEFTYSLDIDSDYEGVYNVMYVSTAEELVAAIEDGAQTVILEGDISAGSTIAVSASTDTIDLGGYELSNVTLLLADDESSLVVMNGTLSTETSSAAVVYVSGDDATVELTDTDVDGDFCVYVTSDATVTVDGGTLTAYYYGVYTNSEGTEITITDATLDCGYDAVYVSASNCDVTVDSCTISNTEYMAWGLSIGKSTGTSTGNTVTVKNTTIDLSKSTYSVGLVVYGYGNEVVVENCSIMHNYFGITQNGTSTPGSTFTVKNSTITGPYTGIYLSMSTTSENYNTLNVSGSTIISTESTPIEVKKTYLTVSESNLTSQYAGEEDDDEGSNKQQDYSFFGSGSAGSGYGIVLAGYKQGQAYSYDFTDLASAVSLSDITYTLSVQYAMDGKSEPWYVLQYMGYEENSTESDYSAEYTAHGATSDSSHGSSNSSSDESTSSAPRHSASSRSSLPQMKNHEVEAKQVSKIQY